MASQSYKLERAERKTNFDEPGWKIERKYDNSVKIGNWFEERRSVLEHLTHKFEISQKKILREKRVNSSFLGPTTKSTKMRRQLVGATTWPLIPNQVIKVVEKKHFHRNI